MNWVLVRLRTQYKIQQQAHKFIHHSDGVPSHHRELVTPASHTCTNRASSGVNLLTISGTRTKYGDKFSLLLPPEHCFL